MTMPFRSQAQRAMMFAKHPKIAKKWAEHTPKGKRLPYRVGEGPSAESVYDTTLEAMFPVVQGTTAPGWWAYTTSYSPRDEVLEMESHAAEDFFREANEKTGLERSNGVVYIPNSEFPDYTCWDLSKVDACRKFARHIDDRPESLRQAGHTEIDELAFDEAPHAKQVYDAFTHRVNDDVDAARNSANNSGIPSIWAIFGHVSRDGSGT